VSYDNAQSLAYKVSYLCEQELGEAMVWAIDNDAFSDGLPPLRTIQGTLADPSRRPPLPVLTSVQSADIWWSGDQQLSPEVGLSEAPGLVAYQDKLYCLHLGQDGWLWLTAFDGTTWSADTTVQTR
jgi:GH18 family chitinase